MEPADQTTSTHVAKSSNTESLVEFTKRALEESAEKQKAVGNYADLPAGLVPTPGDTLDLSSKGAKRLPVEVIELIKDKVERSPFTLSAVMATRTDIDA